MKKVFKMLSLILVLVLCATLTGCNNDNRTYEEEAGTYKCCYIAMDGKDVTNLYEYYTVTLEADGKCVVKSKVVESDEVYEAKAKFSIDEGTIKVVTTVFLFFKITEEYRYTNGQIIMDTTVNDVRVYAEFRR